MKTFYGKESLKKDLIQKVIEHQKADEFIRGNWLGSKTDTGNFKGCFYGCMTQSETNTLAVASKEFGLPLWYVHVTEKIYEGLPDGQWLEFPLQAIEVLPIDLDMNSVRSAFNVKMLQDQLRFCNGNIQVENAIKDCIELFKVPFNEITESAARSAWSAARSAHYSLLRDMLFQSIKES